jgi:ferric-dicitrate binding protein FerR (iron transport regulator)
LINNKERSQYYGQYNTIEVPYGERSQVYLYDGTKVWLNSGTKLRYPVAYNGKSREVYLEGEAYFDVAKDAHHPFIVNTNQLEIKVLGTKFDICAYPEENYISTTLVEGSIKATNTANGKSIKLLPGELLTLNRTNNTLENVKVDIDLYTSWKENRLKFESATFGDVIKKMERWYDVKITVDPAINTKEIFTMTIKTESLREMLQLVSKTTSMTYEIKEGNVLLKKP